MDNQQSSEQRAAALYDARAARRLRAWRRKEKLLRDRLELLRSEFAATQVKLKHAEMMLYLSDPDEPD